MELHNNMETKAKGERDRESHKEERQNRIIFLDVLQKDKDKDKSLIYKRSERGK